jgi:hypothetical protein
VRVGMRSLGELVCVMVEALALRMWRRRRWTRKGGEGVDTVMHVGIRRLELVRGSRACRLGELVWVVAKWALGQ